MRKDSILLSRFFFPQTATRLRQRIAICCSFFIQGLIFATWTSRIPSVRETLGLDHAALGSLLLAMSLGQIVGMPFNGWLVTRFGSRRMLITAGFGYGALLFSLGYIPYAWLFGLVLFAAGFISALSYTAANTQGVMLERCYGRSIMTFFHAMWSTAGLVAVMIASLLAFKDVSIKLHFSLIGLATATLLCFSGGALMPEEERPQTVTKRVSAAWQFTPVLICLGLAVFGCMICEGTIYDWNGIWMRDVVQAVVTQEKMAYLTFLGFMVAVRFVTDGLVERFGVKSILLTSSILVFMGFALMILGVYANFAFLGALVGCGCIGMGASAMTPLCCAIAGKLDNVPPGVAIAEVSTIGAMGFLVAPPVVGYLSKALNLPFAFAFMGVIALITVITLVILFRLLVRQRER